MNPVLAETGPLSRSRDVVLEFYNNPNMETRGVRARLKETAGQMNAMFSKSGVNVWIPWPSTSETLHKDISFCTHDGVRFRVLDRERIGRGDWQALRLQLIHEGTTATA